jgi:hypothetical protein
MYWWVLVDIKRFKENLIPLLTTSSEDAAFAALRIACHGMSGIRTAKILNFASRCCDADEFYLEVGTFSGYSLISAGYQVNTTCFGVDDLSMREVVRKDCLEAAKVPVRESLIKHIGEYGGVNCRFIESDFRTVELNPESVGKLGVLFIDGEHNYKDVMETMDKFKPYFSDNVIIVFDDIQYGDIPKAIQELWTSGEYEMLLYGVSTVNDKDEKIHKNMSLNEYVATGICVMTKKEKSC